MKTFKIEPIPAENEQSLSEGVYHVTVDGDPVICLSDSEAKCRLAAQLFGTARDSASDTRP